MNSSVNVETYRHAKTCSQSSRVTGLKYVWRKSKGRFVNIHKQTTCGFKDMEDEYRYIEPTDYALRRRMFLSSVLHAVYFSIHAIELYLDRCSISWILTIYQVFTWTCSNNHGRKALPPEKAPPLQQGTYRRWNALLSMTVFRLISHYVYHHKSRYR